MESCSPEIIQPEETLLPGFKYELGPNWLRLEEGGDEKKVLKLN